MRAFPQRVIRMPGQERVDANHQEDGMTGDALARSALLLVPAFALFDWFAARFGGRSKERKHERGALLVTLPKHAVLRAGAPSARNDREMDAKKPDLPDVPTVRDPTSRPQTPDKPAERQADAEARRLMLEDGMPERDTPPREQPDLGDLEL